MSTSHYCNNVLEGFTIIDVDPSCNTFAIASVTLVSEKVEVIM